MLYTDIIWDFDGTLFDTYPALGASAVAVLRELGIKVELDEMIGLMKITVSHAFEHYRNKFGVDIMNDEFHERFKVIGSYVEDKMVVPFENVFEVCRAVFKAGGRNFLFTHRGLCSSQYFMDKFGFSRYFNELVTADLSLEQGFKRKPSPDGINYLIQKYEIDKNRAMMIGDRELDIMSGINAGIATCYFGENNCKSAEYQIQGFGDLFKILDLQN